MEWCGCKTRARKLQWRKVSSPAGPVAARWARAMLLHFSWSHGRSSQVGNRQRALRQHSDTRLRAGLTKAFFHRRADVWAGGQVTGADHVVRKRAVNKHAGFALDERLNLRLPLFR